MNWFQRMMIGRYGIDELSKAMLILSLVLLIISSFTGSSIVNMLAVLILALCYVRILSRNINKRYQENMKFIKWWNPIKMKLKTFIRPIKEFRTHRYFKCPHCGQLLRVPKGKGKIRINCPKCNNTTIKKS